MTGFGEGAPAWGISEETFSTFRRSREGRNPFFFFAGWAASGLGIVRFVPFFAFPIEEEA